MRPFTLGHQAGHALAEENNAGKSIASAADVRMQIISTT